MHLNHHTSSDRLHRIAVAGAVLVSVWWGFTAAANAEGDSVHTVIDSRPVDTSAMETNTADSSTLYLSTPAFSQIAGWEFTTMPFADRTPAIRSVALISDFHHKPLSATLIRDADLSPLEWPRVFADQRLTSNRLRHETEALLTAAGLAYRAVVTLEPGELADSVAAAIAVGSPVLFNTPSAPIFYGYDHREPDHWWWVQEGTTIEIVYESERIARYDYWDDHPAANLVWIVTGPISASQDVPAPGGADYRFLDAVSRSVGRHSQSGIEPYPLTLRRLGERLTDDELLPELLLPVDSTDPIGVYRALNVRQRLIESLERLVPMALDSALSAPLRLAQYFYHNSTNTLIAIAETLYERPDAPNRLSALRENWQDPGRRARANELLQEILRAEKEAHAALNEAVAAHRNSFKH